MVLPDNITDRKYQLFQEDSGSAGVVGINANFVSSTGYGVVTSKTASVNDLLFRAFMLDGDNNVSIRVIETT